MTHSQKIKSTRSKKETAEQKLAALLDSIPEVVALSKEIDLYIEKLEKLKNTCPHENHSAEYGGNTGNYDLYQSYWVDVECFDCKRTIRYYDDDPEYGESWKTEK